MYTKLTLALLGTAILIPVAPAQIHGSAPAPVQAGAMIGISRSARIAQGGFRAQPESRHFNRPVFVLGSPYFYSDYSSSPVVESQAPQVVVVQVPVAAPQIPKETKIEPLLIELQGDRYVRMEGEDPASAPSSSRNYAEVAAVKPSPPVRHNGHPQTAPTELKPVVLVYRDGHHEEIRDYTIVDGVIYARGDYWTDGYWTKKIQLTALNLPATKEVSQEHGAKFVLPSSPNQVITRP